MMPVIALLVTEVELYAKKRAMTKLTKQNKHIAKVAW